MFNDLLAFDKQINILLSNDPEFVEGYIGGIVSSIGSDYRINPAPCCGHDDCATMTPDFPVIHCFSGACNRVYPVLNMMAEKSGKTLYDMRIEASRRYGLSIPDEDHDAIITQKIRREAVEFYHQQLLANKEAMDYLIENRHRRLETLRVMKVGLGGNTDQLQARLNDKGFSPEQIQQNLNYFVSQPILIYPYINPFTGLIQRLNTKMIKTTGEEVKGHFLSVGEKALYQSPAVAYDQAILVEGENDLMSLMEQGYHSVIALGGQPSKEQLKDLTWFKGLYLMLDNDQAGERMTALINDELPHIPVFKIEYDQDYKDPDEYYSHNKSEPIKIEQLIENAAQLECDNAKVWREKSAWIMANRNSRLVLENLNRTKAGQFTGNLKVSGQNLSVKIDYAVNLTTFKDMPELARMFQEKLEEIYDQGFENKDANELMAIYTHSQRQPEIILALARKMATAVNRESLSEEIGRRLGSSMLDKVLRETNELSNDNLQDIGSIPKLRIGQFFNITHQDAFFYFTYIKRDHEGIKKLPYLLTNQKQLVPLHLIRKKQENSLLLLNQRYELPLEITKAIGELDDIALSQSWAEKYIAGSIATDELKIPELVASIETMVKRFYYHPDERVYKILALWIYGTYYYELFKCYPYLYLNGKKGSGKSRLDQVGRLLCFNPKYGVNMTGPALFRSIDMEGGTVIIDEIENITDKKMSQGSDLATILKAGYEEGAKAYRCEGDNTTGFQARSFSLYGPKIISNIYGLDSVISDRCILINSFEAPKGADFEDPKHYMEEHREEVRELTSKCCLSAMEHFPEVYKLFRGKKFDGITARMSQIMTPIATLAELAGMTYEEALNGYNSEVMTNAKTEVEADTPEGLIPVIIKDVAMELTKRKPPLLTDLETNKVKEKVITGVGCFEICSLHLKAWIEECLPGRRIPLPEIHKWMPRLMDIKADRRTRIDPGINFDREFNNDRINVYWYRFTFSDFLDDYQPGEEGESNESEVTEISIKDL